MAIAENKIHSTKNGMTVSNKELKYIPDAIRNTSAAKKQAIVDLIDEGDQLTLLGLLVNQIGDEIGLMTPEFVQAKVIYNKITDILNG